MTALAALSEPTAAPADRELSALSSDCSDASNGTSCAEPPAPSEGTPATTGATGILKNNGICTDPPRMEAMRSMSVESSASLESPFAPLSATDTTSSAAWSLCVMREGMASSMGARQYMEDRQVAVPDLSSVMDDGIVSAEDLPHTRAFFGVFDGHGGESAAQFTADNLLKNVLENSLFPSNMELAMGQAFAATDRGYEQAWSSGDLEGSGTTALAAVVWGRDITVANLGDCRAIISRLGKLVELSHDQKPSASREKDRIVAAGGHVCGEGYLNGVLGVSRAIGNWHVRCHDEYLLKRSAEGSTDADASFGDTVGPLIAVPEIKSHRIGPDDEFLIMATDGLWDVFSSQQCLKVARIMLQENNDPQACAEGLVQKALSMHSRDNVSVQVICFGSDPPPMRRPSGFGRNLSVESLSKLRMYLDSTSSTPRPITPISEGSTQLPRAAM